VTALIVLTTRGVMGGGAAAAKLPLERLQALVAIGTHRDGVAEAPHGALPLSEWTEADGTFTNKLGMVQRVRAAVPPAGDSLPGWEILSHLASTAGAAMDSQDAEAV